MLDHDSLVRKIPLVQFTTVLFSILLEEDSEKKIP